MKMIRNEKIEMMSKTTLCGMIAAILFCGSTTVASAQEAVETKHEIGISYGMMSNSNWVDAFEDFADGLLGGRMENKSFVGPIAVEYFYHVTPLVGLGAVAAYGQRTQDLVGTTTGKGTDRYFTLMPSVKLDYLRKKHFGMYGKVAVGATLRKEKIEYHSGKDDHTDSSVNFNWQLSLLGIEAGSPYLRAFLELGVGEQGIGVVGVRCKF